MADGLDVVIFGREYRIACPPGEEEALRASARLVDQHMNLVRASVPRAATDRVAVMAALNIANALLRQALPASPGSEAAFDTLPIQRRIEAIEAVVQEALAVLEAQ